MHTAHGDRWDLELEVEEGEVEEAGHAAVKSKGPHLARKEKLQHVLDIIVNKQSTIKKNQNHRSIELAGNASNMFIQIPSKKTKETSFSVNQQEILISQWRDQDFFMKFMFWAFGLRRISQQNDGIKINLSVRVPRRLKTQLKSGPGQGLEKKPTFNILSREALGSIQSLWDGIHLDTNM